MTGLWVALAGGAGASVRYVLDSAIRLRWRIEFPLGTFLINVTGSFVLGLLAGLVIAHGDSPHFKEIAGTGFLGGYTTFSAASVETIRLAQGRRWRECLGYAAGSLVLALLAGGAGLVIVGA